MKLIKNTVTKNIGLIIVTPILINFLFNNKMGFQYNPSVNLMEFLSSILLFLFLLTVGKAFMEATNKKFSRTTGIITYLISFYLFETITLFFLRNINLHITFLIVNFLWIIFFIFKIKNKKYLILNFLSFMTLRTFNTLNFQEFEKNKNINGDVKEVFYLNTQNIYNDSLFSSITNPVMQGYPQFMSYIDALIFKISFYEVQYIFMIQTTYVFLWLFILLFCEMKFNNTNKIGVVIFFVCLTLNSDWLNFLFLSSLMSERLASYIFLGLLLNLLNSKNENNLIVAFSAIIFSFTFLTKQFFSLILLFIFILFLLNKNYKKYSAFLLFAYFLREIAHLTYFKNIPKDHHISQIDLNDTILDILLFRNLNFDNILSILKNLYRDIPSTYLIIIYILSSIIFYLLTKEFKSINTVFIFLPLLNFIFIFLLYISVWKNMELESPVRYIYSFIPIFLVSTFWNLEKIQKYIMNQKL